MLVWCWQFLVETSKMENGYQKPISKSNSLIIFLFSHIFFCCCLPCKPLSISTAINNIVIIISTYRSYEYYSVCVVCLSSFIRLHALSSLHIALHLCSYIGKCQQNGKHFMRMTVSFSEISYSKINLLALSIFHFLSRFVWRIFENRIEWKRPCTWMKDKHAHCVNPNKNKTIRTHVPCVDIRTLREQIASSDSSGMSKWAKQESGKYDEIACSNCCLSKCFYSILFIFFCFALFETLSTILTGNIQERVNRRNEQWLWVDGAVMLWISICSARQHQFLFALRTEQLTTQMCYQNITIHS